VLSKSRIFKFLKRDCGTIPVAEITSGKIEIFSKKKLLMCLIYIVILPFITGVQLKSSSNWL
jgi:hypothetical protein